MGIRGGDPRRAFNQDGTEKERVAASLNETKALYHERRGGGGGGSGLVEF